MQVNYLNGMKTGASALSAYRRWMDAVSENLANAQTTRTEAGGPYRRKQVTFDSIAAEKPNQTPTSAAAGQTLTPQRTHAAHMQVAPQSTGEVLDPATVRAQVTEDTETPLTRIYDPSHPDAGEEGYVDYPNVNPVTEMVNLILAARAYEANVAALATEKRIQEMALSIGKV